MPYEPCEKRPGRVSSLSLVRYRNNDCQFPTAYSHRAVMIRGYVDRVEIVCGSEQIACHRRSYAREDFVFDPLHDPPGAAGAEAGALDQAAPLAGWQLPDGFGVLRRLLEARLGKSGKQEFVQSSAPVGDVPARVVTAAVGAAWRASAIGFDAVKHLVLCRIERRPPRLDLTLSYLPKAVVRRRHPLSEPAGGRGGMSATPQVLLGHHLKALRLPTFVREYDKVARQCAAEGLDHVRYLLRLAELEMIDREQRLVERRIRAFPQREEPRQL